MPFTVSHIAAVLPLVRRRRGLVTATDGDGDDRPAALVPSALAIGAMVPDFPALLPLGIPRDLAHSLLGAVTADLGLAVVLFAVWALVFRAALYDYAPGWLHSRMLPRIRWWSGSVVTSALLVVAAIAIGIATHLFVDSLTHEGWLTALLPALLDSVAGYPLVVWLHLLLSVVGLAILAGWIALWVRSTPASTGSVRFVGDRERSVLTRLVVGLLAALALGVWFAGISAGIPAVDESLLFIAVTVSTGIAGAVAALVCVVWHVRVWRKRH